MIVLGCPTAAAASALICCSSVDPSVSTRRQRWRRNRAYQARRRESTVSELLRSGIHSRPRASFASCTTDC